jgi:3-hydroxyisobutyrate dehydrogenase-like beta-hydroxyacid dehydrogenase
MLGFIGLGRMGSRIAQRLINRDKELIVFNRTKSKVEAFQKQGIKIASSPAEVAKLSKLIFIILSDAEAVEEVLFGKEGIIDSITPGTIIIDLTTMYPLAVKKFASKISKFDSKYIDAPVLGSLDKAEKGELVVLFGAGKEEFREVEKILKLISRKVYYFNNPGNPAYAKVIYNTFGPTFVALLSFNISLAQKAGITEEEILSVLREGGFKQIVDKYYPRMVNKNKKIYFTLDLMVKDLEYALRSAYELKMPHPIVSVVKEVFQLGMAADEYDKDYTNIFWTIRKITGLINKKE